jgi:hypothetical protein
MQISYTGTAFESLSDVVNFVESKNTLGAGVRWLDKFEAFLIRSLSKPELINLCNNKTFHELGLRCLNYNDWVIAFSMNDEKILIEAILHSSRLRD